MSRILTVLTIMLSLAVIPSAQAHSPHDLPRWLGIGWSDGYHSRTGCPPKACGCRPQVTSYPATWGDATEWRKLPRPAPAPK